MDSTSAFTVAKAFPESYTIQNEMDLLGTYQDAVLNTQKYEQDVQSAFALFIRSPTQKAIEDLRVSSIAYASACSYESATKVNLDSFYKQ